MSCSDAVAVEPIKMTEEAPVQSSASQTFSSGYTRANSLAPSLSDGILSTLRPIGKKPGQSIKVGGISMIPCSSNWPYCQSS
jgi:hypothetical protein